MAILVFKDLVWASVPAVTSEFVVFGMVALVLTVIRVSGASNVAGLLPLLAVFYYGVRQLLTSVNTLGRQSLRVAGLLPDAELLRRSLEERYPDVKDGGAQVPADWAGLGSDAVEFVYPSREI